MQLRHINRPTEPIWVSKARKRALIFVLALTGAVIAYARLPDIDVISAKVRGGVLNAKLIALVEVDGKPYGLFLPLGPGAIRNKLTRRQ